jgi:nitronate monooxygenase
MLHTYLTDRWHLSYPIVSAPMAGVARGRLARAVSEAGGLGTIGVGSADSVEFIAREAEVARGEDGQGRFGIGLMTWAIEARPELLDAAIRARPFLLSVSFGSLAPYVARVHEQGIILATQVNSRAEALEAERAGVDVIVAQGTEAGGHTSTVSTLPLLQIILESVRTPVLAAGGIASPRGVAAALAAGAEGVWMGTAFLACPETAAVDAARERVVRAEETETVLTRAFDRARGTAWPERYPGRALRNRFSDEWNGRERELVADATALERFRQALADKNYDLAYIYAGQAVGLVTEQRPAAEVVRALGDGAEQLLRERVRQVLGPS